jgi:nucleoside-diphosphate-sugar epimerase
MENVSFVYMDIGNHEKMTSFFSSYKPNIIFHMAAHFANQNSVDHPLSDISTNISGFVNILENQKLNSNLEKIVYCSSSCVYGNSPDMSEDSTIYPYETPYAINKFVGELYCKYYSEIQKIPTVSVRIFNTFGPGEMPGEYRNVIPNFIYKALKGETLIITGTGEETRDFTYVGNTIDLLLKSAFSDFRSGEVFNAGTGTGQKIIDIAKSIIQLTESKSEIEFIPARNWDHVIDRKSDISKSKLLLDYAPELDIEAQLKTTIDWISEKLVINK